MEDPKPRDADPARILIVDDNPDNLELAGDLLQARGFDMLYASGGQEALDLAQREVPDLILLDVTMPEMDGYEVCRRLKGNPVTGDIPVIFLTANTTDEDLVAGFRSGGVDYVAKPFRCEELVARSRTHIELLRKQKQVKQANRHLKATNRELAGANELKSEFLSIAATDLKNPLNVVLGLAEAMLAAEEADTFIGDPTSERAQDLRSICDCSRHMRRIIQDLLESESLEGKDVELRSEPQDIGLIAKRAVSQNRLAAAVKNINLLVRISGGCIASVDERRILEAMDNLVSNAIKYSPLGLEVAVEVRPFERDGEQEVLFQVRDNGPGLTEEDKEKLFGRFQRLSAQPTGGEPSTGLGLAIVKRLVELHRGHVWVESEAGKGATFCLALPSLLSDEG